jgi:hypothetical protein
MMGAVSFLLNDFIVPGLDALAKDPFDPHYQSAFVLPDSLPEISIYSGNGVFDTMANITISHLEYAAAYLLGADVSLNRYSTAVASGDQTSAILQLEALLQYMDLYTQELHFAGTNLEALLTTSARDLFANIEYDPVLFKELLNSVLASGRTDDDLNEFARIGVSPDLLTDILRTYTPPEFGGAAFDALVAVSMDLQGVSTAVPEPNSPIIVLTALCPLVVAASLKGSSAGRHTPWYTADTWRG